jgi:hypothetical protein
MKVAQYEVLGSDAKEMSVPSGTIETFGSGSLACGSTSVSAHRSSRPGRLAFSKKQPSTSYWATFIGSCRNDFLRPNGAVRSPVR